MPKKFFKSLAITIFLSGLYGFLLDLDVEAATINVPGDYATITLAIAAASNGDTIQVAAGTYSETPNRPKGRGFCCMSK